MKTRIAIRAVTALVFSTVMGGCGDGLTELNVNPNEPVSVGAEFLLPAAIVSGAERLHGSSLNMDMVGLWVQHYAEHRYTIEDRFEVTDGAVSGHWTNLYAGPLRNLYEVVEKGEETERPNVVAVGTILKSWLMQAVTDLWGDAGYSQALLGRESPPDMTVVYDTQEDIYDGLLSDLGSAVSMMAPSGPKITAGDLLYKGNMDQWRKFANSLRLRVAMRLSQVDQSKASAEFSSALAAGVFTSNADNAMLRFVDNGVDVHPIYGYERNRDDHSISATLVDTLKSLSDPRLPIYARPNASGGYVGTNNGDQSDPPLTQVSRIGTYFSSAATPAVILSYSEVLFLRAEAAERGWVGANAGDLYQQAITAAMSQIGVSQA
ncbi:MAG: SusD/RagB family nutrient-binding outer membrane lipoprotein, partial [Longimicrobiales bacterium]|nr:SusD/RagB family nutrient-binding outer membrane lipoprotein [Longimicrobiales bacterium]